MSRPSRTQTRRRIQRSDAAAFRTGSSALGLLGGLLLGTLLAVALAFTGSKANFALVVFGSALVGALGGFAYPLAAWHVGEALVHMAFGAASVESSASIRPNSDAPDALKWAFWVGVVGYLVAIVALFAWRHS